MVVNFLKVDIKYGAKWLHKQFSNHFGMFILLEYKHIKENI